MYVKEEKCKLSQTGIMFLGHKISRGLVRMDERKVKTILDWPKPKLISVLRSFLRVAN